MCGASDNCAAEMSLVEAAVRLIAMVKEYFLWPRLLGRPSDFGTVGQKEIVGELVDEFIHAHAPSKKARTVRRHGTA